jgi:GntR family transcriptional regulator of vanillate catabolism
MSQTVNVLIKLREAILSGELAAGERLLEVALAKRFSVSRTPIRTALVKLAEEGLLEEVGNAGYAVREFSETDIRDAIEARGTLEGMAVRLAAERGVSALALRGAKDCIRRTDALLAEGPFTDEMVSRYLELNAAFHAEILSLTSGFVIPHLLERVDRMPFASPNAFVIARKNADRSGKVFSIAQEHHRGLVDAIEKRQGTRAEAIAREHAHLALQTLETALEREEIAPGAGAAPLFELFHASARLT